VPATGIREADGFIRRRENLSSSAPSVVASETMSTWIWVVILAFGLVKLPIAALMLWIPFRSDAAMDTGQPADSSEEDGGSKTLPDGAGGPRDPHPRAPLHGPRRPRRGPHGSVAPPSPARVRGPRRRGARRVRV
jgi:hypothetical protein